MKRLPHALGLWALLLACSGQAGADTVTLKDGTVVEGEIVEETPEKIVVKVKFGKVTYARAEIQSIVKSAKGEIENAGDLRDVLRLKSGLEHSGLLVSEDQEKVVFEVLRSGKETSKTIGMRLTFKKAEVEKITTLTPEQRAAVRAYLAEVKEEAAQDVAAEGQLDVQPHSWEAADGKSRIEALRIDLDHFTIESNAPEDFLRAAAVRLQKVFGAFKTHFGVDRNQDQKVRVVLFNSMEQYYAAIGNKIQNPAFYAPKLKLISAGCDVARYREEIAIIRKHHNDLDKQLEDWRRKIDAARADLRKQVKAWYEKTTSGGKTTVQGKAIMDAVSAEHRQLQLALGQMENQAKGIQEEIESLNRRNDQVYDQYTRHMFATLYHEGFHAFLDNFLCPDGLADDVPRWLNEGLAQYFELARVEGGRLILGKNDRDRMRFLRMWQKEKELAPLAKLVGAGQDDFLVHTMSNLENSTKNYLQSWALVQWLGEHQRLSHEILLEYVRALSEGKDPLVALPVLSGIDNEKLEKELDEQLSYSFGIKTEEPAK